MSRQTADRIKNAVKEYFTFVLALIIIPVYIVILIIQKLEEMLKETKARIDHPEKLKEENTTYRIFSQPRFSFP